MKILCLKETLERVTRNSPYWLIGDSNGDPASNVDRIWEVKLLFRDCLQAKIAIKTTVEAKIGYFKTLKLNKVYISSCKKSEIDCRIVVYCTRYHVTLPGVSETQHLRILTSDCWHFDQDFDYVLFSISWLFLVQSDFYVHEEEEYVLWEILSNIYCLFLQVSRIFQNSIVLF